MVTWRWISVGLAALMMQAACIGSLLAADVTDNAITVVGFGEVHGKPQRMEIELSTGGTAELTGDAVVKYRDSLKRTLEAFDTLKIPQLKIEQQGLGLDSLEFNAQMAARFGNQANQANKPQITISRSVKLSLSGLEKMKEEELTETLGKLLDTAKDSGATIIKGNASANTMAVIYGVQAPSPMVTFIIDDVQTLRKQAAQAAFQEAKNEAEQLATLAGGKLGPVLSMEETFERREEDSTNSQQRIMMMVYGAGTMAQKTARRVASDRFADIPVQVYLRVRFGLK